MGSDVAVSDQTRCIAAAMPRQQSGVSGLPLDLFRMSGVSGVVRQRDGSTQQYGVPQFYSDGTRVPDDAFVQRTRFYAPSFIRSWKMKFPEEFRQLEELKASGTYSGKGSERKLRAELQELLEEARWYGGPFHKPVRARHPG